jgi:hypothetical protein
MEEIYGSLSPFGLLDMASASTFQRGIHDILPTWTAIPNNSVFLETNASTLEAGGNKETMSHCLGLSLTLLLLLCQKLRR